MEDKNIPIISKTRKQQSDDTSLSTSINKLEDLLDDVRENKKDLASQDEGIPVLDDLIDPDNPEMPDEKYPDYLQSERENEDQLNDEHLLELFNNVENKIADELDSVMALLKESIKESIVSELKSRIEKQDSATIKQKPARNS